MNKTEATRLLKKLALQQGFSSVGVSKAGFLEKEARDLDQWLSQGFQGEMSWMENHFDKRLNPTLLVDGAKTVVSLTLNYFPTEEIKGKFKFSKYAYGRDYHKVIRKKCKTLLNELSESLGEIQGRAFTDSAPVMDKAWAQKSGLGWVGKNTNLINKHTGSFFFIAELILDYEFEPDGPATDHCGDCTLCIDACPTDALVAPYQINGSQCISYYTIELKESIPESEKGKFQDWVYGCDICQDVCPWNKKSSPTSEADFQPKQEFID
jgi:epoxyqueuosine reductase